MASDSIITLIKQNVPEITGISPYVQKEVVMRTKNSVEGVLLKGIDYKRDVSTARNKIVTGEFNINPVDTIFSRVVIGDKLASKLNIAVGSKVILFGLKGIPSPFNQPKIKQFIVSGIYETGLRDYDDVLIYTDIETAQKLAELKSNVTGIEIKIVDIDKAEEVVSKLKTFLEYPLYIKSLFKQYRGLFTWVELQKAPTPIILGLIIIVATFNIIGTLLMLILEKTQSIGILKALGASKVNIMKIFILDGLFIGIIGIILGNALALTLCLLELKYKFFSLPEQYYMKNVPFLLKPEYFIIISVIALLLTLLATVIPALLASKVNPLKSIRFA
jgi:lipoprotein-releasing system permease protein